MDQKDIIDLLINEGMDVNEKDKVYIVTYMHTMYKCVI